MMRLAAWACADQLRLRHSTKARDVLKYVVFIVYVIFCVQLFF